MNAPTTGSGGLTGQSRLLIGVLAIFAVAALVVRTVHEFQPSVPPTPVPTAASAIAGSGGTVVGGGSVAAAPTAAGLPGDAVKVSILTTNTKAEWLRAVTTDFNAARKTTAGGRLVQAEVLEASGPDEMMKNLLEDGKKPVLWSPGDSGYIEQALQYLKDMHQPPIVTGDCPPITWIPSGFAMWRPMAQALGWPDRPISWKTVIDLAGDPNGWARYGHPEWGKFTFGHSHPDQSTTGKNMLASLAYASAGKTSALTPEDVRSPAVKDAFRKLEKDTYHYGLSTSALLNLMVTKGPAYLHAATTSETAYLYSVQREKARLTFPWVFVFPAEGTFWSDNPTCILQASWVSQEQQEAARIYRDDLLGPEAQDKAVAIGLRPANPNIPLHDPISLEYGTDPRVTSQTVPPLGSVSDETMAAIVDVFKETKKKATVAILLDMSASMQNPGMAKNAVEGATYFVGQLLKDDKVYAYVFNDSVTLLQPFGRVGDVSEGLSKLIGNLYPQGQTVLYDAVCRAVVNMNRLRDEDQKAGEARLYGVVLLSDGKDTRSQRTLNEMLACLPTGEDVEGIKIYTIAYGSEADKDLLTRVANRTNGRFYTATPENIKQIYLQISAEQ